MASAKDSLQILIMKKLILFLALFLPGQITLFSQSSCPCCLPEYDEFDFWLGEWNVYDTSGLLIGENHIFKIEDNCVLHENWQGSKGSSGQSFNFYDQKEKMWHQTWVDNQGGFLLLKGKMSNGNMVLKSDITSQNENVFYHQITWSKDGEGVVQVWETFSPNHQKIQTLFTGRYQRK